MSSADPLQMLPLTDLVAVSTVKDSTALRRSHIVKLRMEPITGGR